MLREHFYGGSVLIGGVSRVFVNYFATAKVRIISRWRSYHELDETRIKCTTETSEFSANCQVKIPDTPLLNEFRSPVQQRKTSNSTINYDTLDGHLDKLRSISERRKAEMEKDEMERKAEMKRADTERADVEKKIAQMESDELTRKIAAQMQNVGRQDFRVHVEDDSFADWPQTVDPKFLSLGRTDFSIE
ncbi:uncharacterized protein EAF01_000969 [Botrytis porri]|nr:uncharacterized protein EAF01_000969 [Botrytis porri]KAF7914563.1 hypothetical protein EAF01_000969 [Botrytis porri]